MIKSCFLVISVLSLGLTVAGQGPSSLPAENKPYQPITVGIVVDNSGSFRKVFDYVDKTVQQLAENIQAGDEGSLIRFTDKDRIEILQDLTSDKEVLRAASEDMHVEGGQTAISEAL